MANIQINQLLETTTAQNNDYIAIDNGSATKKIKVSNFNATGAASAAQSAAAAAQSASAALAAQTAAEQAEDDAQALITSAQTIVSDAQTYANEASTSAGTASTAANTATAQAAIATQAATQAGTYAQNVDSFAKTAKSWAVGGTGTRQGEDTDNSKYYSQQAHDSEINAAASEQAAATSEANAAASETNAAASESNAAASASSAAQSESNASTSETNAALSASNALTSANNAATSESNAATSETNADLSSEDSEAWSVGQRNGVDVPPSDPTYHNNAKYWADVASGGVSGVLSFNGKSGIVVPALGDYAANIVEFDNTGSSLQSTTTQDAIEEVQDNVDGVASDLTTLDNSLKPVAKSGAYNDLTGKPTLGTAAAKNATSSITSGSTDLVESGAVYSGLSVKANSADLGTAAGKNFTTSISSGSGDLITSGAVYSANQTLTNTVNGKVSTSNIANNLTTTASGKVLDARQGKVLNDKIKNKVLYLTEIACSATTGNFVSYSNSAITADHVVAECVFANPSAITTDVTWTTANGSVKLNGTCASATTCSIVLVKKDN